MSMTVIPMRINIFELAYMYRRGFVGGFRHPFFCVLCSVCSAGPPYAEVFAVARRAISSSMTFKVWRCSYSVSWEFRFCSDA